MKRTLVLLIAGALSVISAPSLAAGDPVAGKDKAIICAFCHGVDGKQEIPLWAGGVAKLHGMDEHQLLTELMDYRYGRRVHPMMQLVILPYSDKDLEDVAAYYSSLK
jgi:cytochrome c553